MKWISRKLIVLACALSVAAGVMTGGAGVAHSAPDAATARLAAIESIGMSGEGAAAALLIKLSAPATFTSYKTTGPLRLVIDFSQATQGAVQSPVTFNKGNIKTVSVNRYDTDAGVLTRVTIELVKDLEPQISSTPGRSGELLVAFASGVAEAKPVPPPAAPQQKQAEAAAPVSKEEKVEAPAAAVPFRLLKSVEPKGETVQLALDGPAGEVKTFRLNKPERFVVDLFGVRSGIAERLIPLNVAGIASARIGAYPDKLRVVFDAVNGSFPDAVAEKLNDTVVVRLQVKQPDDNPNTRLVATSSRKPEETKTTAPPAEAKAPPVAAKSAAVVPTPRSEKATVPAAVAGGPGRVESVDFQVVDGISRVAVKVLGDVEMDAPAKTPGFVTLTLKGAALPRQLQRSLDTRSFVSPVLRVSPFIAKSRKGADAKIRIALRAPAPFEVKREGDMIFVDFKNPDGITADRLAAETQDLKPQAALGAKATPAQGGDLATELVPSAEPVRPLDSKLSYKGRKVTLEFADAEVRKIFQLLSEVSTKNFVLGDDVQGTISIKLVNVPWDQALDIILDTKGLDKREDGNIIIIKGKGKFKSQAEEEQEIKKALTKAIELKTETFSINYAEVATIVGQLNSIKTERGAITQDSRTNKVIVKDIPQAIDDMRRLISQLDVPEKQVMIEARIVEASSTFTRSLGVNWGAHYRDGAASFAGINQLDTSFGGLASTAAPLTGLSGQPGGSMGISFGTLTSNVQLDMRLNAAASAGMIKIVSTPKVATLNNKTAKITQGQQIPYTSSTSDKVETKFIEAALSLEVTPHINANGTIGMKIDAKNDSPGAGGNPPPINKKQATTEMLLRDGETTVIGGIYVDSDTEADEGVPFLMDIPFIGKLFKSNTKQKAKTELLIFITPRILGSL